MMRLTYPICCGLDVHKNVIVTTIVTTDKTGISEYKQKSFSTINSDIQKFHDWLIENNCKHVCMESTGKYWITIFNYLENDIDVCLTHPKYVKAIKGKKTDKKDSKIIMEVLREEKTLNEIAAQYEIHPNQLSRWKAEFMNNATRAFSKETDEVEKVKQSYEKDKDELLKQIRQLSYENAWLKKKSGQF
jgi:transposase